MALSLSVASCGGDDDNNGNGGTPGDGGSGTELTEAQQKQKLEETAKELMAKVSANDFNAIKELGDYVDRTFDNTDSRIVENWFNACVDACLVSETDDEIKNLYSASNFTGIFELQGNKWEQTGNADYLQFMFSDESGRECVITLTHSGKDTKVHHESFDDEDYIYSPDWTSSYTRRVENAYMIPENISLSLTQDGKELAAMDMKTSISIGSGDFDYTRDKAEVSVNAEVSRYKITVNKAAFNAGKNASASAELSINGETLITASGSVDGHIYEDADPDVKNVAINLDILGKVQLRGTSKDAGKMIEYYDLASSNDQDEAAFKEYVKKGNELLDVKLYFDGSSTSSAYMEMYALEEGYPGYEYWNYEPVIRFADGTGYATIEDYFDEGYFDSVIKTFENLVEDFTNLFGK